MKNQTTRRDFLRVSAAACPARIPALSGGPEALSAPCSDGLAKLPANDVLTWGKEPIEARTSQRTTTDQARTERALGVFLSQKSRGIPFKEHFEN